MEYREKEWENVEETEKGIVLRRDSKKDIVGKFGGSCGRERKVSRMFRETGEVGDSVWERQ